MNKKKLQSKKVFFALSSGLLLSFAANAETAEPPFHITGTTLVTIKTKEILADGSKSSKTIGLLKVIPSETFTKRKKEALKNEMLTMAERDYSTGIIPFSQSPGAVDLGMNNVPVLDQGEYGTCVTFSTTAAMDALLKKGDFISQQCTLELTKALGNDLWNGAYYSSEVIDPLKRYGLVKQGKCNAVYPNASAIITLTGYKTRIDTTTAKNISYKYSNYLPLQTVKTALKAGHRVTIGFGLNTNQDPISVQGFDTKIAGQMTTGGLWACTQPMSATNYCGSPNAGHEVVIIGYDDNQELLKIRNSWSTAVGDQGNFYMTYTFFNTMNGDGTEIY